MLSKLKNQGGFSLIEVLVSMAIFVVFTSILINSYSSIVVGQREANEFRGMYVEARGVFETLTTEFRDGMVDYAKMGDLGFDLLRGQSDIRLVSKDAQVKTRLYLEDGLMKMQKGELTVALNSEEVRVSDFKVYVTPSLDPYDPRFVSYDINQFHPKVTIFARFEKDGRGEKVYNVELQTTISSRIYNQVYLPDQNL